MNSSKDKKTIVCFKRENGKTTEIELFGKGAHLIAALCVLIEEIADKTSIAAPVLCLMITQAITEAKNAKPDNGENITGDILSITDFDKINGEEDF